MSSPNTPEPPPTPNDSTPIVDLVVADLQERKRQGIAKYGVPLQAHNGRRPMVDAYQEVLDLACYVRQELEERAVQNPTIEALTEDVARWRDKAQRARADADTMATARDLLVNEVANAQQAIAGLKDRGAALEREGKSAVREVAEWKAIADRAVERETAAHEQLNAASAGSNSETLAARILKLAENRNAWQERASQEAAKALRLQDRVDTAAKALGGGK